LTNDNAIGSASAAERQLVALAFTLGVHSISGFKAPLLIDTPLARVSDENRVNFAEVLLDISKDKQMILILTPDEFSDNIKPIFENVPKFEIEILEEEYMTNIKEVN
jgi:DNA sulfur modification protein DndD